MQIQDLERIRFVTRHYRDMLGLQTVSVGLLWFSGGLALTLSRTLGFLALALQIAVEVGAIALLYFSAAYYGKTFGSVERREWTAKQVNLTILLVALGCCLLIPLVLYRSLFEWRFYYLAAGGLCLGMWVWRECRLSQLYYLVLGAPLVGLAVAPAWAASFPTLATAGTSQLLSGMALILAGLLDHLQLVRVLRPLPTALHEESEDAETTEVQR